MACAGWFQSGSLKGDYPWQDPLRDPAADMPLRLRPIVFALAPLKTEKRHRAPNSFCRLVLGGITKGGLEFDGAFLE